MRIGDKEFNFKDRIYVMGILNVTPDSFSDGGKFDDPERALDRALEMEEEGADIIDIGGESTRPGSDPVSVEEELKRVLPVVKKAAARLKVPISIDTAKAAVADACINEGAALVNDVTALTGDPEMVEVVKRHGVPAVLMHMKGNPKTMQIDLLYKDVVAEVRAYLRTRIAALAMAGIPPERLILDPGIGFGKEVNHNVRLITEIDRIAELGCPVMIGTSRKSFIGKLLDSDVNERLEGSLITAAVACFKGARMIRCHDIGPTVRMAKVLETTFTSEVQMVL